MNKVFLVALIFSIGSLSARAENIILTNNSIGKMSIQPKKVISLAGISQQFPKHKVTHEIRSGDSPDYHAFTVSNIERESLFTFISFIDSTIEYKQSQVQLDEISVHSAKIKDQYGVSVGMRLSEVMQKRKNMQFGDGHMDNYIGNEKIWYLFEVENRYSLPVSKETAITADVPIELISWPYPRWR